MLVIVKEATQPQRKSARGCCSCESLQQLFDGYNSRGREHWKAYVASCYRAAVQLLGVRCLLVQTAIAPIYGAADDAELVVRELEKQAAREAGSAAVQRHDAADALPMYLNRSVHCFTTQSVLFLDTQEHMWHTLHCNEAFCQVICCVTAPQPHRLYNYEG